MKTDSLVTPSAVRRNVPLFWYALAAILFEKIIQHIFVTVAFATHMTNIRSKVVPDPDILMILGGAVAVLFAVALWGALSRKNWSINLAIGLALFDLIGEFVAQGTLKIDMTVSFLVAALLLGITLWHKRQPERIQA